MPIAKSKSEISKQLKKASNIMKNSSNILNNKYLMYFILILVVIDLFLLSRVGEIFYIILYILFGLLISLYTHNMLLILTCAAILTNIVKLILRSTSSRKENFEISDLGKQVYESLNDDEKEYFRKIASGEVEGLTGLKGDEKEAYTSVLKFLGSESTEPYETIEEAKESENVDTSGNMQAEDHIEKVSGFTNKKQPKTIEGLELEAKKLIKTQEALQENMKSLEPMLNQAQKFMNDLKKINKK